MDLDDPLEPHHLERLRRSIVTIPSGQRDGLERDQALAIIRELQRLQESDRWYRELVGQLRRLLDGVDLA